MTTTYSLTIRFPSGTEFRVSDRLPAVGATVQHGGRDYVVVHREQVSRREYIFDVDETSTGADGGELHAAVAEGATVAGHG